MNGNLEYNFHQILRRDSSFDGKVNCLVTSKDTNFIALGLNTGDIEVYKVTNNKTYELLSKLETHKNCIYDMKFSPYGDMLVSCSEQLCFWSIKHIINNPLMKTQKRRSSRFTSQRSSDVEEVDAMRMDLFKRELTESPWANKQGSSDKPELLACIRFSGKKANKLFTNADFTEFQTIDDEGVYYHLKLLDICETVQTSIRNDYNYNFERLNSGVFS
ncbi:uncharacterized protein LOC119682184 [Teleopsis dalmanni]|uniref:uncharacterized protein LOC119682184 n=1 Tax=Teleopsis dalmanni TaxID=139649 RepID=UPI0018CD99A9|nr:uncharacterized protein LOC119682184 [Teleopsis dalmanni]